MLRYPRLFGLLMVVVLSSLPLTRCEAKRNSGEIRERLLASFKRADKDFVKSADSHKLTHFSFVGTLTTANGRLYVCDVRWVLQGMRAPRGFSYITFCDRRRKYLGKIRYDESRPLRCEHGKVYLFGDIAVPPDPGWSDAPTFPETDLTGNVIDVSLGFQAIRIYHTKVYGSSSL